jgi:protein TonB
MNIGEPKRIIIVEPLQLPEPIRHEPVPEPEPVAVPENRPEDAPKEEPVPVGE